MPKRKPEVTLRTAGGILYKATRRKVKNLNIRVHRMKKPYPAS